MFHGVGKEVIVNYLMHHALFNYTVQFIYKICAKLSETKLSYITQQLMFPIKVNTMPVSFAQFYKIITPDHTSV